MPLIHWDSVFFLLFAALACFFAIAVVISGNVVRMATYLVVSLAAVAGLFFVAGADFLGAMQLMVYVGGTLVLLAFGVMLTARGPFAYMRASGGQWILAAVVGGSLLAVLVQNIAHLSVPNEAGDKAIAAAPSADGTTTRLGLGLLGVRTDELPAAADAVKPAAPRAPGYLLVFEILSVHLLVVLVGAAYLARAKRKQAASAVPAAAAQPQLAAQTAK